ncbi:MAG: hypothetical protein RR954_03515, partial [Christensenellaceae bacterium]
VLSTLKPRKATLSPRHSLVHLSSVCPQTSPFLHTEKQQNSSQILLPLISLFYVLWIVFPLIFNLAPKI